MIVTEKMKKPVYKEKLDFSAKGVPRSRCLACCCRHRNNDIAKDIRLDLRKRSFAQREREHVGGLVLAAVPPVQRTHGPVADKENAQLGITKTDAPQQVPELCPECLRCQPLLLLGVFYPDVHCVSFLRGIPCRDNRSDDGIFR